MVSHGTKRLKKKTRRGSKRLHMGGLVTPPSYVSVNALIKGFNYASCEAWYDANDPNGNGITTQPFGIWADKSGKNRTLGGPATYNSEYGSTSNKRAVINFLIIHGCKQVYHLIYLKMLLFSLLLHSQVVRPLFRVLQYLDM